RWPRTKCTQESRRRNFVTPATGFASPFAVDLVTAHAILLASGADSAAGGSTGVQRLVALRDLRALRPGDPGNHDDRQLHVRDPAEPAYPRAHDSVRIRRFAGRSEEAALQRQLLLDGDALHPLRHRDRLPVSARRDPPRARLVRVLRVPDLPDRAARRLRLHLAQGSARMALDKPLRDYGLQSERLLMPTKASSFEQEVADLEQKVGLTTLAKAVAWAQTNSMWPDTFGLACCAIEMMSIVGARYDIARFGMEPFRGSPRQADLLIVSGRVSHKMAAPLRQIYDQMLEPKWVIAMGACASSGGMFNNYAVVQSVDKIVPVDMYVPGCPPRPDQLIEGIIRLHEAVRAGVPPAYELRSVAS